MSRSHTKHPLMCNGWCKKGNSKYWKRIANHKYRKYIQKHSWDYISKCNYHKKFHENWIKQGDEGHKPYTLKEWLVGAMSDSILNSKSYDEKKEILGWKKFYYYK